MNQKEAKELIAQLEEDYEDMKEQAEDAQAELVARPSVEIEVFKEVTIENSAQSDTIGELGLALAKCQSEFKAVEKNAAAHKYNYANLTAILEYAQPIYTKYDLSIVQLGVSKVIGKTVFAGVKTVLIHKSGEWISSEMYQPALKSKMNSLTQNIGIINSYFRRYMIQSMLCLSTEDNDGKTG